MKKIVILVLFLLSLLVLISSIVLFLPNEMHFKLDLAQKKFSSAQKVFPKFALIAQNNQLGLLYKSKKYEELEKEIKKVIDGQCSIENEKISEFCANIFYLEGLTNYQIGEKSEKEKQNELWQEAILDFSKVMTMNEEDSQKYIWSEENIEFIKNKLQGNSQEDSSKKDDTAEQDTAEQGEQGNSQEDSSEKDDTAEQGEQGNSQEDSSEKDNTAEQGEQGNSQEDSSEKDDTAEQGESRLPKEMQDAIEAEQKQLEEDQNNNQTGFNRSKYAADKNNLDNLDPFFQDFFGDDPFFQTQFSNNELTNQIQDPNLKDW